MRGGNVQKSILGPDIFKFWEQINQLVRKKIRVHIFSVNWYCQRKPHDLRRHIHNFLDGLITFCQSYQVSSQSDKTGPSPTKKGHPKKPTQIRVNVHILGRSVLQRCSVKKVFIEISQNSQENTCTRVSFLIKLQAWSLQLY